MMTNTTKAKIRSLMSVLFNHAIRCEWLAQDRNPILMVRRALSENAHLAFLEVDEIQALLSHLEREFRLMVLLAATTSLRRSELFGLKWGNVDSLVSRLPFLALYTEEQWGDAKPKLRVDQFLSRTE